MAGQRLDEAGVVLGIVHVAQRAAIEHRHVERLAGVAVENVAQPVVPGQNLAEQRTADERRMAALAAKHRVHHRCLAGQRRRHDAGNRRRPDQRNVDRQDQRARHRGRQHGKPGLHRGEHAAVDAGVVYRFGADAPRLDRHRFGIVAGHDTNVADAGRP